MNMTRSDDKDRENGSCILATPRPEVQHVPVAPAVEPDSSGPGAALQSDGRRMAAACRLAAVGRDMAPCLASVTRKPGDHLASDGLRSRPTGKPRPRSTSVAERRVQVVRPCAAAFAAGSDEMEGRSRADMAQRRSIIR